MTHLGPCGSGHSSGHSCSLKEDKGGSISKPRLCGRNEREGQSLVGKVVPGAPLRDTGIKTNSVLLFYFIFYFLVLLRFGNVIIIQYDNSKTIYLLWCVFFLLESLTS